MRVSVTIPAVGNARNGQGRRLSVGDRIARRPRWGQPLAVLVLTVGMVGAFVLGADAESERRCRDLGVNCHCSEPLQATGYTPFNTYWLNPNDTGTAASGDRPCSLIGTEGMAVENGTDVFATSEPAVLGRLPAGHSVARVIRRPSGHVGMWDIGDQGPANNDGIAVRALRYYIFWSPDYQFAGEGTCTNSKLFQAVGSDGAGLVFIAHITGGVNLSHLFLWRDASTGLVPATNTSCCTSGWPNALLPWEMRGQWWRIEAHVVNPAGGVGHATRLRLFAKNVTSNLPEKLITDTAVAQPQWRPNANLQPWGQVKGPAIWRKMTAHPFRWHTPPGGTPGTCNGFNAISHLMYAKWNSDTGQRIGAAIEVEGGQGPGTPGLTAPGSPTGLSVR